MSLESTSTATGWARDLADKLILRYKGSSTINTVRQALDANGWPMLFCSVGGNEAEGQPVIVIRIEGINNGSVDIFGNSTIPFAPHQAQIAYEVTSGGAPIPSFADLTKPLYEVSKIGVKIQDLAIANGTAVTEASMNAATPVLTLDSIDWPNKGA